MSGIRAGVLHDVPYLAIGDGPPVVVFAGLGAEQGNPTGLARAFDVRPYAPLTARLRVYIVRRRLRLRHGSTIADLADDYARAPWSTTSTGRWTSSDCPPEG